MTEAESMAGSLGDERVVPTVRDGHYFRHVCNYTFAARYVKTGDNVLDGGCGTGYGAAILSETAARVIGIDRAPAAIAYSRTNFSRPNVHFLVMDCVQLAFPSRVFDIVVALQVFEHVAAWSDFLAEVRRVLRPAGLFVLSTPNRLTTSRQERASGTPHYHFHVNEVTARELRRRLREHFATVEMFGVRRRGSRIYSGLRGLDVFNLRFFLPLRLRLRTSRALGVAWDAEGVRALDDFVVEKRQLPQALELVSVCRTPQE